MSASPLDIIVFAPLAPIFGMLLFWFIQLLFIESPANPTIQLTDIKKELHKYFAKEPYGIEPEVINFYLILLTAIGKIILKARGGDKFDLNNLKDVSSRISYYSKKKIFQDVLNSIEQIKSYGINGKKRNYVDYNKERKVKSRNC